MEGNQMKIREALMNIDEYAQSAECHTEDSHVLGCLNQVRLWVKAALAAPPRQCDVGTAEEQHRRFIDYCNACDCPMGCIHRKEFIGMLDTRCASMLKCYIRWAQMPYAEEGGAK